MAESSSARSCVHQCPVTTKVTTNLLTERSLDVQANKNLRTFLRYKFQMRSGRDRAVVSNSGSAAQLRSGISSSRDWESASLRRVRWVWQ